MSFYRDQLEKWLGKIDVIADRVADIGGGANPAYHRVRSWNVKNYMIFDNKLEEMKQEPSIVCDLNKKIDTNLDFDIVFCLEVFEYIFDPIQAIKNIHTLLKQGGIAYLSFPFIYPIHSPHQNDYLRYTRYGILKLLEIAGLKVVEMIGREAKEPKKLLAFYESDGMHIKADSTITGYLVKCVK